MNKAVIPYILAGYPDLNTTKALLEYCAELGITYIELGLPFSDPSADGPVIADAAAKASQTFEMKKFLKMLQDIKLSSLPLQITIMTYANTLIAHNITDITQALSSSGIKGLLIPDLPIEESAWINNSISKTELQSVWMVSQNLPKPMLHNIVEQSTYYLYLMGYVGTTGKSIGKNLSNIKKTITEIKKINNLPIAIGFGIQTRSDIEAIWEVADGAIVGTALIRECEKGLAAAKAFIKSLV